MHGFITNNSRKKGSPYLARPSSRMDCSSAVHSIEIPGSCLSAWTGPEFSAVVEATAGAGPPALRMLWPLRVADPCPCPSCEGLALAAISPAIQERRWFNRKPSFPRSYPRLNRRERQRPINLANKESAGRIPLLSLLQAAGWGTRGKILGVRLKGARGKTAPRTSSSIFRWENEHTIIREKARQRQRSAGDSCGSGSVRPRKTNSLSFFFPSPFPPFSSPRARPSLPATLEMKRQLVLYI